MAQTSSPNADTSVGGWVTAPLFSQVDDTTPDDSDYISQSSGSACVLALSTISQPNLDRGVVYLYVRARTTGQASLSVVLKSDTTTVLSWSVDPPGDFVTFAHGMTPDELAQFTDWSLNSLTLLKVGTGTCDVSQCYLSDLGTMDQGAAPLDDADMHGGGHCSVTGLWFPASQLKTVDGKRFWTRTRREPKRETES